MGLVPVPGWWEGWAVRRGPQDLGGTPGLVLQPGSVWEAQCFLLCGDWASSPLPPISRDSWVQDPDPCYLPCPVCGVCVHRCDTYACAYMSEGAMGAHPCPVGHWPTPLQALESTGRVPSPARPRRVAVLPGRAWAAVPKPCWCESLSGSPGAGPSQGFGRPGGPALPSPPATWAWGLLGGLASG